MNTEKPLVTQERLKELMSYDENTGLFTQIKARSKIQVGDTVGYLYDGYIRTEIDDRGYLVHRLAFLYMEGEFPPEEVDHINHDRSDNRMVNLRKATRGENQKNKTMQSTNTSGVTGVSWHKRIKKWHVYITVNKKIKQLGYFAERWDAICARKSAENKYGFHPNHGWD